MLIYIPKKIKVGYQNRKDTYTEKLAYVIYYDEKGILRKEKSWTSWRSDKIDPDDFENKPIEGFVLNKKVGDYHGGHCWENRCAWIRIYDPRGFEFEISTENLLYILENTNSIKGKGLEGEFVYGWDGKDLVLLPTSSVEYKENQKYSELVQNSKVFKGKDLILGATYLTKQNEEYVYLGRYDYWEDLSYCSSDGQEKKGKRYFFYSKTNSLIKTVTNLKQKIINLVSKEVSSEYSKYISILERESCFSPVSKIRTEEKYLSAKDLKTIVKNNSWYTYVFINNKKTTIYFENNNTTCRIDCYIKDKWITESLPFDVFVEKFKPKQKIYYLENGNRYLER